MSQWLGCRTRNHKVVSPSPITTVSSLGIGSLNHNWVPQALVMHLIQYIYRKIPHRTRTQPSNARDVFRRCLSSIMSKKCHNNYYARTQGELSKSRKQHIRASYNSQNMKFRISYNCIPRTKYVRGILWFSRRYAAASASAASAASASASASADTSSFSR